jgi:hypothetical protein
MTLRGLLVPLLAIRASLVDSTSLPIQDVQDGRRGAYKLDGKRQARDRGTYLG